jgi:retinaldehyde-binding protein 1
MTLVPTKMTVDTTLVKANPEILIRFSIWAQRVLVRNPYYQVLGTCIAETFENFSTWDNMKMSSALSFSLMRHTFHFSQKCMAYRLGGIYVAKQPWSMSALWFIVRPFMSTKMQQRVHLLGDEMEQLYQFVPKSVLSQDFNGDAEEDPMWFLEQGIAMEAANNQK